MTYDDFRLTFDLVRNEAHDYARLLCVPPEGRFTDAQQASRQADVEQRGVAYVERLFRELPRTMPFEWREGMREAMRIRWEEILDGGEEDLGAVLPRRPLAGGGGSAVSLLDDAKNLARYHARSVIGTWSDDSELMARVVSDATYDGLLQCARTWDPERGSFSGWLSTKIYWAVKTEYAQLSRRKQRNQTSIAGIRYELAGAYDDAPRGNTRAQEAQTLVALIDAFVATGGVLSTAERAEFHRRRAGGAPATDDAGAAALRRANRKIQARFEAEYRRYYEDA